MMKIDPKDQGELLDELVDFADRISGGDIRDTTPGDIHEESREFLRMLDARETYLTDPVRRALPTS